MSPDQLAQFVQTVGVVGLLAFAVLAFYRHWVVLGSDHNELKRDRDEWKELALRGLITADRATTVAAATINKSTSQGDSRPAPVKKRKAKLSEPLDESIQ